MVSKKNSHRDPGVLRPDPHSSVRAGNARGGLEANPGRRIGQRSADRKGGRRDATPDRRRIQFEFEIGSYRRLEHLQSVTESTTKAEVVRQALRLYEYFVDMKLDGWESITLRKGKEIEGPIPLRLLSQTTDD